MMVLNFSSFSLFLKNYHHLPQNCVKYKGHNQSMHHKYSQWLSLGIKFFFNCLFLLESPKEESEREQSENRGVRAGYLCKKLTSP